MSAVCTDCRRPLGDNSYYCKDCLARLERRIGDLPALLAELEVTATRQSVIGSGDGGRKSAETALPFNWNAADLLWTARNTVTTWARHCSESGPAAAPATADEGRICAYLATQVAWLRGRPEVVEFMDEVTALRSSILKAIDRAAPLWFAGPCDDCQADLYCRPGAREVHCRTEGCGLVYEVDARREWLLASVEDRLASPSEISAAVTSLEQPVSVDRIYQWAKRGRIVAHSVDVKGRPLYRVGDILDRLHGDAIRKAEKLGVA